MKIVNVQIFSLLIINLLLLFLKLYLKISIIQIKNVLK